MRAPRTTLKRMTMMYLPRCKRRTSALKQLLKRRRENISRNSTNDLVCFITRIETEAVSNRWPRCRKSMPLWIFWNKNLIVKKVSLLLQRRRTMMVRRQKHQTIKNLFRRTNGNDGRRPAKRQNESAKKKCKRSDTKWNKK
eukprot:scaffold603450_cov75-Attheya_sp.AAC.1